MLVTEELLLLFSRTMTWELELLTIFLEWSSSNLMQCNPIKSNELVFQRERHRDEMSNIQECSEFTVLGLNFQQDCRFVNLLKACLARPVIVYVITSL